MGEAKTAENLCLGFGCRGKEILQRSRPFCQTGHLSPPPNKSRIGLKPAHHPFRHAVLFGFQPTSFVHVVKFYKAAILAAAIVFEVVIEKYYRSLLTNDADRRIVALFAFHMLSIQKGV